MRMTANPNWQPGDPLWIEGLGTPAAGCEFVRGGYSNYLFNIREDSVQPYPGPDAASWPNPNQGRALPDGDEIGDLIERVHRDRAAALAREACQPCGPDCLRHGAAS